MASSIILPTGQAPGVKGQALLSRGNILYHTLLESSVFDKSQNKITEYIYRLCIYINCKKVAWVQAHRDREEKWRVKEMIK